MLLDQHYLCPITGHVLEPVFDGPWQPSVDRLDNARGYVAGNLRVVALIANLAMNVWGEEPLLRMAELIVTRGLRPGGVGWTKLRLLPAEPNALIQEEETPS